ncbi:undecaprenyl-phosphate glucose phosphotransferase [Blastochloris sulfoviridis]|uniref:Undecaprenyl-phosphate glucose phosphotransferase n=1 Tax=Blastochloris sulfoviridis TaxID=50712 RepID=A0A5M6I3X4_9HYPH|nr:undecaprenyl-phosphate glucose phosphotransferase [Blastochloris sulfoviridis]KAA5602911.1 undecaprenyl-phosphate glucose phosphotransferase [Blastochloris sulfoviridis]
MLSTPEHTRQFALNDSATTGCAPSRFRISAPAARILLDLGEFIAIVLLGLASGVAYSTFVLGSAPEFDEIAGISVCAAILYALTRGLRRVQRPSGPASLSHELMAMLGSWVLALVTMSMIAFVMKSGADYSRGFVLVFATVVPAALAVLRWTFRRLSRPRGGTRLIGRGVVVLADPEELADRNLKERLDARAIDVVSSFALLAASPGRCGLGEVDRRTLDHLIETCRWNGADEILLVLPWQDQQRIHAVLDELTRVPLPVRLLADRSLEGIMARSAGWNALTTIEVQRAPLGLGERLQKRTFDILAAAALLLLLMPLLLGVAALIKLDSPGPVLFRQRRNGFNGRVFRIWKFRSMTTAEDGATIRQAVRDDARVTRLGRWLRRTSIDELPQLWNVLAGDMSIVGPRPHAVAHNNDYTRRIANYALRHHMKPGLTGWAQVNGYRGETPHLSLMERRVEHDLWYINNWSIWLDIRILATTTRVLLKPCAY